jgi:hypothetical protein
MAGTSAAKAAHHFATLSQRQRRCATQRQENVCLLPVRNSRADSSVPPPIHRKAGERSVCHGYATVDAPREHTINFCDERGELWKATSLTGSE